MAHYKHSSYNRVTFVRVVHIAERGGEGREERGREEERGEEEEREERNGEEGRGGEGKAKAPLTSHGV